METVIVSRHNGAVALIHREMPETLDTPILSGTIGPDDVRGRRVVGNLPLHLAALAAEVVVVEFAAQPPRGQDLTLPEMDAAGARLARYRVTPLPAPIELVWAQGCGRPVAPAGYTVDERASYPPSDCDGGRVVCVPV